MKHRLLSLINFYKERSNIINEVISLNEPTPRIFVVLSLRYI